MILQRDATAGAFRWTFDGGEALALVVPLRPGATI